MMIAKSAVAACLAAVVVLSGCASKPQTIYQWESYQPQVYQHFKGESPDQQIAALEKDLQVISAKGGKVPPGYHAHLGYLYGLTGKTDQMVAQFEDEKKLFPESAPYINFLLTKQKGTQ